MNDEVKLLSIYDVLVDIKFDMNIDISPDTFIGNIICIIVVILRLLFKKIVFYSLLSNFQQFHISVE